MGRRRGPGLDRAQVVQAAIGLVNRLGPEACGVNRVARELGIKPPSLYNHVGGNTDLREAVALAGTKQLYGATETELSGEDSLACLANAFRTWVKANPGLYRLMSTTSLDPEDARFRPTLLAGLEPYTRAMALRGLNGEDALHAIRSLRAAVHGFVLLELDGQFRLGFDADVSWAFLLKTFIRGLGPVDETGQSRGSQPGL